MPSILPGARVKASYWPDTVDSSDDTVITCTPGSYQSGSPGVAVTFIASETTRVKITTSLRADNGSPQISAAAQITVTWRLHEGTGSGGTQVQAEAAGNGKNYQVFTTSPGYIGGETATKLYGGLTPGVQYWAELRFQQTTTGVGSCRVRARRIMVEPAT